MATLHFRSTAVPVLNTDPKKYRDTGTDFKNYRLGIYVMFVLHICVTKIRKPWSVTGFKIALLSNFKTNTNVYNRVFDTLITSLGLCFGYNVILKGQQRYSRFLGLLDMYLVFTCVRNLQQLSNNAKYTTSYVYSFFFEGRVGFRKKVKAKNTINAISVDVKYLIKKRGIEKKPH